MHRRGGKLVTSPAGAQGIAQLMPGTAAALAERYNIDTSTPLGNLLGGAYYLAEQLKRFKSIPLALSAYNSGPGGSESEGRIEAFPETQNYVKNIMARYGGGETTVGGQVATPSPGLRLPAPAPPAGGFSIPDPSRAGRQAFVLGLASGRKPFDLIPDVIKARSSVLDSLPVVPSPGIPSPPSPTVPVMPNPQTQGGFRLAEMFYDPLGGIDWTGKGYAQTGAIGGHDTHAHVAFRDPQSALRGISLAQKLGLAVRENPYTDPVDPVHTEGSFHYQTFPGLYRGKRLGEAIDVSGDPRKLTAFYKRLAKLAGA